MNTESNIELSDHEKRFLTNEALGIGALIMQMGGVPKLKALIKIFEDIPGQEKYVELLKVLLTAYEALIPIAPKFTNNQLVPEKLQQPQLIA